MINGFPSWGGSDHMSAKKSGRLTSVRVRDVRVVPLAALAFFADSQPAVAQTLAQNDRATELEGENRPEIVVTGTRVERAGFSAPTPVTVVTSERLRATGTTNIGDALNQLPAFRPSITRTYMPSGSAPGSTTLDLRGMGAVRTLVLLDGRRFVPSTTLGSVDINLIPTNLVGRTEVVTGGASAAYGADAVSGVVNFILNTKLVGLVGEAQYGVTERGDDARYQASFAAGSEIFGGNAHIVVSAEYEKATGVGDSFTRNWGRAEKSQVLNSAFGTNGRPFIIYSSEVRNGSASTGGLITAGPLRGIAFDPLGNPTNYSFGEFGVVGAAQMIGGGEPYHLFYVNDFPLAQPIKRYNLFGHLDYFISNNVTAFVESSYANVKAADVLKTVDSGNITINLDNAFLPTSVRDQMVGAGLTSFRMGRLNEDLEGSIKADRTTYRIVGGLKGDIGGGWSWDAYYQYGHSRSDQTWEDNRLATNFSQATDAVLGPNGTIVCRSTLTNPANGCVPINLFGVNRFSTAARDYVLEDGRQVITFEQNAAAATVRGEPVTLWAGPVSVAAGVEYRKDRIRARADVNSLAFRFSQFNATNIDGSVSVKEGFFETVIPLLRDVPLAQRLEFNGAVRVTDYNTSGTVASWKGGLVYEPSNFLRFRMTRSRDIRAPNANELFSPAIGALQILTDPFTATQPSITVFSSGNVDLKPETADTFTGGVVFQPQWHGLRGLQISVDYFDIKLNDPITRVGAANIISRCYAGVASFCDLITRDSGTNAITQIRDTFINYGRLRATGLDFEFAYNRPLGNGRLALRLLGTRQFKLTTTDLGGSVNRAGQLLTTTATLSAPKLSMDAIATYTSGPFSLSVREHYIAKGNFNPTFHDPSHPLYNTTTDRNSTNINSVPERFYTGVNMKYRFDLRSKGELEIFGGIENLFDQDPPPVPNRGTNPQYYDIFGRRYYVGARVRI